MPDGTKPRKVDRVAVLGAGTMGGGIAMSFATPVSVTLIETSDEALKRGMGVMQKNWEAPPPWRHPRPMRPPSAWR